MPAEHDSVDDDSLLVVSVLVVWVLGLVVSRDATNQCTALVGNGVTDSLIDSLISAPVH